MAEGTFDVSEFRSKVEGRYHRAAHYSMEVGFPQGLYAVDPDFFPDIETAWKKLRFDIEASNLPGVAIATDDIRRQGFGAIEKMPYVPVFDSVDITVRSDVDGKAYEFFQTWMKLIVNFDERYDLGGGTGITRDTRGITGYEVSYKSEYTADTSILVHDVVTDKPTIKVTLKDCYPLHVGNVPLNWAANEIVKFPVTLTFTDWFNEKNVTSYPTGGAGQTPNTIVVPGSGPPAQTP